ncbi:MAG: 3'-5' exonuclease [Eubacteriales bacterium]|nr:3'-5' exonuclease [Eubacteriales bacterium]
MIKEYVALDLETTGLSPARDRILEIGAVRITNGKISDTYSVLVDCGMRIPERIVELTGISNEIMDAAICEGRTLKTEEAVSKLLDFCQNLPILGHNVLFDYSFIKRQAVNQGKKFENHGIDTLKIARKFLGQLPQRSLEALCDYYGIVQEKKHRAQEDAYASSLLYQKLAQEFEKQAPEAFLPHPLVYQVKKQGPATNFQKAYLNDLVKYHRICLDVSVDSLTKNDASRLIDKIIFSYGKIKR